MAKKTQEEYVNELEINNPKITVIGDYVNANTPILHKCKIHNYEWMVTPCNIVRRDGCPKCNGRYRRTHDEYVEELKIVNPNLEVIGTYINATTKILHRCKTHNVVWMKSPENALNGSGCKQCSNDILSSLFSKTHEEYIKELADLNPNVEVLEKYNGASKGILHRCKIDGYEWTTQPSVLLSGSGCPRCNGGYRRTEEEYVKELSEINPNIELIGKYKNITTQADYKCKICNYMWSTMPEVTLRGCGCPKCGDNITKEKLSKSKEQYILELRNINPDVELIDDYSGANVKVKHRCKIDNTVWEVTPSKMLHGNKCPSCFKSYRINHDIYLKKISQLGLDVIPLEEYVDSKTKILHRCLKCDVDWYSTPSQILKGAGCPKCRSKKISQKLLKTHEEYVRELNAVNPDVDVIEQYINTTTPIKHRCRVDGYEWYVSPSYMLSGCVCPSCNNSKGENEVKSWLELHNISFVTQKRFEDCKDKRYLPFDFYLPDHNVCIEYDGEQHFRPIGFGCKDESLINERFESLQKHDQIKNEYCESKGIRLIRIPYFDDVKEKLDLLLA